MNSRPPRRTSLQGFPPTVRLVGIGWYFALCIVLGVGLGVLLDNHFGTKPGLTLLGLVFGLGSAFYGGYVQLRDVLADIGKGRSKGQ